MTGACRNRKGERESGRSIDGNEYEVWDIEDGRGIYVHFKVCPYDTEPETMAFPYDMARRMVTDWDELDVWPYDATGGKAIRELGYEPVEQEPCPFCGSTDTSLLEGGPYSYDQVYCNHCLTEFTFYPPAGTHRIGGPQLMETLERWNQRVDPDPDRCPFCGCEAVEFDGIMNYSTFFADAYCSDCRVRFEFQKVRKGKNDQNNLKRARKAFGGRA